MNFHIGNYWYLLLLLVIPVIGFLLMNFIKWRKSRRNIFAESRFQVQLFEKSGKFSKIFPLLYLIGFLFLVLAMLDFLGGKEEVKTEQKLNNVIFLMDVSNSMNAEDIAPSRLTEAKNVIVGTLGKMKSDRVGVVVFAGEAASIMPLTTDYTAAETYISGVESSVVKIQGTDFLKAMEVAVQKFKNVPKGSRQVVLISDGEDNEGNEKSAINLANKEGIAITSVGIGSEEGAPVPEYIYGQLMGYKTDLTGQTVITKRQVNALQNMASSTGGNYVDGNNLDAATSQIISSLSKNKGSSSMMVESQNSIHYYQYFLAVSLLMFILIYLLNPKRDFNI